MKVATHPESSSHAPPPPALRYHSGQKKSLKPRCRGPIWVSILLSVWLNGCGILIGNVKPVDEKAENYRVLDLSRDNDDWVKLPSALNQPESESTQVSDVAYQSKSTASIISLNSVCRPTIKSSDQSLKDYTNELLLGISDSKGKAQEAAQVDDTPALATTVQGKLNGEPVKIRTIVLRHKECVYDLMFIARPERFSHQEAMFARFADSLRIKK